MRVKVLEVLFVFNKKIEKTINNSLNLHPSVNNSVKHSGRYFSGGDLECKCPSNKVVVRINDQTAHNHVCGCLKC